MLRSIQFNDQPGFMTIKIHNIVSDFILAAELQRITPKKIIPEKIFFLHRVLTKLLGKGCQFLVLIHTLFLANDTASVL